MRRKIIILTLLYWGLAIISFTSCGSFLEYDATICDITFAGLNSTYSVDDDEPDRFTDEIGFQIWSVENSPTCLLLPIQLFNSANAMTKCAVFQNQLLKSTYQLSFDRSITLNNDTIHANTNLLAIKNIRVLTDIEINEKCKSVTSSIIFKQELIDQIEFGLGEYVATFECSTTDDRKFLKTRRVIFKE